MQEKRYDRYHGIIYKKAIKEQAKKSKEPTKLSDLKDIECRETPLQKQLRV